MSASNNQTRAFLRQQLSTVRAGLVRGRRNVMSIFHKQQSDEVELSGEYMPTLAIAETILFVKRRECK